MSKQPQVSRVHKKAVFWLATMAAILYCSWPLGALLNPVVGKHALASQLEAPHQPFNWLFILLDIMTGLLAVTIGAAQLKRREHRFLTLSIISYATFGALVALAAAVPLDCDPDTTSCGPLIHHPFVIIHGLASIFSVIFLFVSMILLIPIIYKFGPSKMLKVLFAITAVCWAIFGVGSIIELVLHITGNAMQDFFITLCSASLVLIVATIEHVRIEKLLHLTTPEPAKPTAQPKV